jgi:type IV pilus assembly protein PilM
MAKPTCVGLDIGSSSVKVVQLKETSKGYQLINFGIEPLPPQTIVDGAIMNQTAVVDAIRSLKNALKLKVRDVATAISGHSVIIKKIKLPPMTPEELEEQIPWEAEHHIPFSKDDVDIDHQLVSTQNSQGQMEILLVAAKKEVVADFSMVIREAKLNPMVMDVAAFTIQNAFEVNYEAEPGEAVALINVGAALSNINIIFGGTSAFTRDVTVGGNIFTEEIQKRLNVSQEEAEAWKIGSMGEGAHEVLPHEVEAVLAEVADGVAGQFQRSLDFFLASAADAKITRIYLCGGSAKVPALQKSLEAKARTPVEIMDPFRKISVDDRKFDLDFMRHHAAEAAVAVGLALRRPGDKTSS